MTDLAARHTTNGEAMSINVGTGDVVVHENDPHVPGEVITIVDPGTARVRWPNGESEEPVADLVVIGTITGGAA